MNVKYKYILLLSTGLGLGLMSHGQNQKAASSESEIVMTKAELESFLTKIADRKRAQIEKRRNELLVNQEFKSANNNNNQSNSNSDGNANDRIFREFDRINSRIDMLMLNGGNRTTSYTTPQYQAQPQTPSVIYQPMQQQQPDMTYRSAPRAEYPIEEEPTGPSEETLLLQRQVSTLNEEVRVLTQLANNKKDGTYDEEIEALKAKIDQLNTEVDRKNQPINDNSVVYINKNDALKKGLENYKQEVFYANNSTTISNADKQKLDEVIAIVMKNDPRVTVVVRGFASKTGNARYNSELSFKRAETIKQYLLAHGLKAKNVMTMYHGVDAGTNEQQARRSEVSLLVE